jgi:hypothetical protein
MQELETRISIAGPEKTGGLSMTQIILKTAELSEDTEGIADKEASGGIVVFGLAIGPAYARIMRRSGFKTPSNPPEADRRPIVRQYSWRIAGLR